MAIVAEVMEMQRGTRGSPFFQPRRPYDAFLTRLLLRHRVQTRTRRGAPSTMTRTVCRLGYHRRFVLFLAWLTLLPVTGPLVQTVQTRAIGYPSNVLVNSRKALKPISLRVARQEAC